MIFKTFIRNYAKPSTTKIGGVKKIVTKKNPTALFQFGNFSKLVVPSKREIENSKDKSVLDFDALRIFPSVRIAMKQEIKDLYILKNTYLKSKDELEIKPTPVQSLAIKKINQVRKPKKITESKEIFNDLLENQNKRLKVFTIAAETGSGKTWSYLSCVLSKLKEDDLKMFNKSKREYVNSRSLSKVRSVILLPTNELVDQVYDTLSKANNISLKLEETLDPKFIKDKNFSDFIYEEAMRDKLGLNILKWGAGEPASKFFNFLNKGVVDILVTTPTKLQSLGKQHSQEENPYRFLYNVDYCVVDEADTLFDPSWFKDTTAIIEKFSKCKDIILVSATIPKNFQKSIGNYFKDTINVVTSSLHKVPSQINVKIIDSMQNPYNGSKIRALAQALYAIQSDNTEPGQVKRVIVFVNNKKDVHPLISTLCTKFQQNLDNFVGLSGDDTPLDRADKIKPFIQPPEPLQFDKEKNEYLGQRMKVLVTTDLFARGVNFQSVKNVIIMDFPNNSVDLVHRIGRTGRMKQSGRVFIITDKKSSKSWIKALPNATKRGVRIG